MKKKLFLILALILLTSIKSFCQDSTSIKEIERIENLFSLYKSKPLNLKINNRDLKIIHKDSVLYLSDIYTDHQYTVAKATLNNGKAELIEFYTITFNEDGIVLGYFGNLLTKTYDNILWVDSIDVPPEYQIIFK